MTEPIRLTVIRWQCPFCSCTRAKRATMAEHIARCWQNPAAQSCHTCEHRIEPSGDGFLEPFSPEGCARKIELPERGLPLNCSQWTHASPKGPPLD